MINLFCHETFYLIILPNYQETICVGDKFSWKPEFKRHQELAKTGCNISSQLTMP